MSSQYPGGFGQSSGQPGSTPYGSSAAPGLSEQIPTYEQQTQQQHAAQPLQHPHGPFAQPVANPFPITAPAVAPANRRLFFAVGAVAALILIGLVGWLVVWPIVDKGPALPYEQQPRIFDRELSGLVNRPGTSGEVPAHYFQTASEDRCLVDVGHVLVTGTLSQQIGSAADSGKSEFGWTVLFATQDQARQAFTRITSDLGSCRPEKIRPTTGQPRAKPAYQSFSGTFIPRSQWNQIIMVQYGNTLTLTLSADVKDVPPRAQAIRQRVDELMQQG